LIKTRRLLPPAAPPFFHHSIISIIFDSIIIPIINPHFVIIYSYEVQKKKRLKKNGQVRILCCVRKKFLFSIPCFFLPFCSSLSKTLFFERSRVAFKLHSYPPLFVQKKILFHFFVALMSI